MADKHAMFKYTINASSSGRLYFYLDETWGYAYAEPDCDKKIAMAKFSSKGYFEYNRKDLIGGMENLLLCFLNYLVTLCQVAFIVVE